MKNASEPKKSPSGIFDRYILGHREAVFRAMPQLEPALVDHMDILVSVNETRLSVRRYMPEGMAEQCPTLLYIPGTAYVANQNAFTHVICSHICQRAQAQVIVLNHRLAPENQCPDAYYDSYQLIKYFIHRHDAFSIDIENVVVAGYSSGGNLAALAVIKACQEGLPIKRQLLVSPLVDLSRALHYEPDNAFFEQEEQDNVISEEFVNWFLNLYIPDDIDRKHPQISPFWETSRKIAHLPPTDIILAERDRFRSDGEYFFEKLTNAGVDTQKFVIENETHAYLWRNLNLIQTIGDRLYQLFYSEDELPQHTLSTLEYPTPEEEAEQFLANMKPKL